MLSKNEQKFIKSLKVKKYRTREKRFFVEGTKNVQELINSDFEVELIIGSEAFFETEVSSGNHRIEVVKTDLLTQLGTFKNNQDGMAVAKMMEFDEADLLFDDHLFVLDGVNDPGNLGTIIRTLDWFGFHQLICSPDCAEFYHPKVVNSTMGSFTRLKVYTMDLERFYAMNKLPVYAADMQGTSLSELKVDSPVVMVMGSESHGIREISQKQANQIVSIPSFGKAESLNVGVATGIIAGHLRMS